jgi:Ca2+-transporting ATPase
MTSGSNLPSPVDLTDGGVVAQGLDPDEAERRLAEYGANELPQPPSPSIAGRVVRQLADPLSVLLLIAGGASLVVLGDVPEGLAIMTILTVNVVVGVSQEARADRAVQSLRQLTAPTAKVRRGGITKRIPAAGIVPDDVIEVTSGDRVPADAVLVEAAGLGVDESALTGEAASADKAAGGRAGPDVPMGDRNGELFSGTLVVRGSGTAVVARTGADSEVGRIAATLHGRPRAPLEIELSRVSRQLGLIAVVVGAVMIAIGMTRVNRGEAEVFDIVLAGIALAIAAVPESLAAAVTTALALGAQRMAKLGVIVRKLAAIEALGATTVIAADKTGTLTTGHLTVVDEEEADGRDLWQAALRCNDSRDGIGDAVDVALRAAAEARGVQESPRERLAVRPFDATSRSMAVVHEGPLLTVKGAPETVLERCIDSPDTRRLEEAVPELTRQGLRVLGFAEAAVDDLDARDLRPVGLVALSDELRDSAVAAIAACRAAGIRVVMVTGDHAETARAVAERVGIDPDPVVTGTDLADGDREELLRSAGVVARVDPRTKLELVHALRASDEVVTMTGDGVNDAPALRNADVGVALAGEEGTDVAREAAAVVVTNGELGTIVAGVREGRRLYHNVTSMISYLLAGNLSEIFLVIAGLILWPELVVPLLPVHLLWINLVTDGIPALALGVDRVPGDPLTGPPRRPGSRLLAARTLVVLASRATVTAALVIATAQVARGLGWNTDQVRTQVVLSLVFAHLMLAYVARARRTTFESGWWRGTVLRRAVAASLALQALVVLVPALGAPLSLTTLPPVGWAMATAVGILTPVLCDAIRPLARGHRAMYPPST